MQFLYEAYRIITQVGQIAFGVYVDRMKMPLHDRIRVLNKARMAAKVQGLNGLINELEGKLHYGQGRNPTNKGYTPNAYRFGHIPLESATRDGVNAGRTRHFRDLATASIRSDAGNLNRN